MSDKKEPLIQTPGVFGENGNFLLERELGRGGMGGVYMGRDKMLDRPVAVKVMLKDYGEDAEFIGKFKKEAQAAARLIHPNIAQVYSYGISDGMPYIAMELVTGGSLEQIMRNSGPGRTDIPRVLKICEQVAQALRCAADHGLVHGDIKPENILLDANGAAKLVDFGLAGMQKETEEIWGTPYYIAPEKLKREVVDYRADMYNLGGTLYHALTGVAPFEGPDANAVVRKRFEGAPKKPSLIRPELTSQIDSLVMGMLAFDKKDRFPTFEALLEEFKKVMTSGIASSATSSATTRIDAPAHASGGHAARLTSTSRLSGTARLSSTARLSGTRRITAQKKSTIKMTRTVQMGGVTDAPDGEEVDPNAAKKRSTALVDAALPEEESADNVGRKVMVGVTSAVVVIGLIAGALIWYTIADKKAREEEKQAAIVKNIGAAREAIAQTRGVAKKFADEFEDFAKRATVECEKATKDIAKAVPEYADRLKPAPSAELLAAIALTNAPALSAEASAGSTNAVAAAVAPATAAPAATQVAKAPEIKRFRPPTDAEADPNSPEGEEYLKLKKAFEEEQARLAKSGKAAEAEAPKTVSASSGGSSEDESPAVGNANNPEAKIKARVEAAKKKYRREVAQVGEDAVKDVNELWMRAYSCQASVIKIRVGIDKVLAEADRADTIQGMTEDNMKNLGTLSGVILELYNGVKASKDVENVQKGITFIKQKGAKSLKLATDNLYRRRKESEREIAKLEHELELLVKERNAAEARVKLVADEREAAKAKFESLLQNKNFELLEWDAAIADLTFLKNNFKTPEGQLAAEDELKKVRAMKAVQAIIVRNLKDYKFRKSKLAKQKATVIEADMKEIHLSRPDARDKDSKKTYKWRLQWVTFYKEYHANFNELIITYIEGGRKNGEPKLTLQEWGEAMCGVALTFKLICSDDQAAATRAEQIAKDVAAQFPSYVRVLRMMFPELTFEDVAEE